MKISLYDILYNFSLSFFTLGVMWQFNTDTLLYQGITLIATFFLILKILIEKHSLKEYFFMAAIMLLCIICFIKSNSLTLIFTPLFIFGAKNIKFKNVFTFNLWIRIISFLLIISFSLLGLRSNNIFYINRMTGEETYRWSLGFEHANQLHMHFFIIVLLIIYVIYDKFNLFHTICIIGANYILYQYSVSRTGFLSVILSLILVFIFKKMKKNKKSILKIFSWIVPILTLFSLSTSMLFNYNSQILILLNKLLQGRISNSNYYWKLNGVSFLGKKLISNSSDLILDNSYVILWLNFGILILIIFNLLYVVTSYKLIKNNRYADILIIFSFALYGITEGFLSNVFLNLSLLYFSTLFYKNLNLSNSD
ncbi:MAG: hypothetical protein HFI86_08885 [Bacilli bacterium]|nr:hypothetical protein [Bacilli bacterium]